jgi:pyruvate dehydrogenase E2 component (dihydrolipoamide acetyltransferase)
MPFEFRLPSLGENVEEGDVLTILVREGDQIEAEQGVVELETEKATMEVPCPRAGKVSKIHVAEGDTVKAGALILTVETADQPSPKGESPSKQQARQEAAPPRGAAKVEPSPPELQRPDERSEKPSKVSSAASSVEATKSRDERDDDRKEAEGEDDGESTRPAASGKSPAQKGPAQKGPPQKTPSRRAESPRVDFPGDAHSTTAAGPAIRRLARELGVDLSRVEPTEPGGRITREDLLAHVRRVGERAAAVDDAAVTPPGKPASDDWGSIRVERMTKIRRTIAERMFLSYSTIPQLTNFDDADITELEQIRQSSKRDYAERGVKLTALSFIIKAAAASLRRHPIINASVDLEKGQIIYKEYVHVGVAVDTPRGLVVPVLRDVDRMTIPQVAEGLAEMAEKVRGGEFSPDDLAGGSFTISNLGSVGGSYSTPIINPPQVAILLPGRARTLPMYIDPEHGKLAPRLMLPLSLTYDHRLVDGAAAARFLNEVIGFLEAPSRLLLAP